MMEEEDIEMKRRYLIRKKLKKKKRKRQKRSFFLKDFPNTLIQEAKQKARKEVKK